MILRAIFTEGPAELANLDKNPEGWGVLACCCRSHKSSSDGLRAQFWCAISAVRLGVAIDGAPSAVGGSLRCASRNEDRGGFGRNGAHSNRDLV